MVVVPQVEPVMLMILSGEMDNSVESFIEILSEEPALRGNLKLLLQDMIAVAVQEGNPGESERGFDVRFSISC